MKRKSFLGGAFILTFAGVIVRIIGFVYRIYISNYIGSEGMGLFQLIFPVYSLVILTLTSGVSIAVSKMIAEEIARNKRENLKRITVVASAIVFLIGTIVILIMYIFLDPIVLYVLKDVRTYKAMLYLLPTIPIIAVAAAVKGYFYGIQNVTPTAISQIVEQIVRMTFVITFFKIFNSVTLETACVIITLGMCAGELSNLLVVYIAYRKDIKYSLTGRQPTIGKRKIATDIFKISLPISFNRFITSAMSAIELILIPRRLLTGGMNYTESIEQYGKLTGMAMPLITFPTVVTSSLATILVPAISEDISLKRYKKLNGKISRTIQMTILMGTIFFIIFYSYPHQISNLLYRKENIGEILKLLSFTCIFTYLHQTLLGILNGLGKQTASLKNSVIGYAVRISFVYFLVPKYGTTGYIWGIIISTIIVCILDINIVMKTTGMAVDIGSWVIKPIICSVVMVFIARYIYKVVCIISLPYIVVMGITISINVLLCIILMLFTGVIKITDIKEMLPSTKS